MEGDGLTDTLAGRRMMDITYGTTLEWMTRMRVCYVGYFRFGDWMICRLKGGGGVIWFR